MIEKMTESSPNFAKDKFINPTSPASPKQYQLKEIHAQVYHNPTAENQRKRILESSQRKMMLTGQQWFE